jgi:hypothetical protein
VSAIFNCLLAIHGTIYEAISALIEESRLLPAFICSYDIPMMDPGIKAHEVAFGK